MPNSVNAEANAPSRKYLTAASCDISRLRRASAHSRYSGRERTSRATNRVSRSLAAGKTSMPATAKSSSGNTSVVVNPALTARFSLSLPGTAAACAAKESTRLPWASGSSRLLGEGEQAHQRRQQDRALEEERRAVDGDRAHGGDARLGGGVPVGGERHDRGERGDQGDRRDEHLGVVTGLARHEGLDQDPDERRADDDQRGRELPVLDLGCVDLDDRIGRGCPQAVDGCCCAHLAASTSGWGSFFCTSDKVCFTAGFTMSVTGFG